MVPITGKIESKAKSAKDLENAFANGTIEEMKDIEIYGIIHSIKEMSKFSFILLRSMGRIIQCVYNNDADVSLKPETSVRIKGEMKEANTQNGFEILIKDIEVLSSPKEDSPLTINKKNLNANIDTDMEYRPVSLRNARYINTFKLTNGIVNGMREFFEKNNFVEIRSPKLVSSGAEGGANIFKLDYFGKKAYLAQSPQFYKQMTIPVFERVYEIAPVFRAEKHDTARHLNEYVSIDFEMGFISSFYDLMNMETGLLRYSFEYMKEHHGKILEELGIELPEIDEIPSIPFREAKETVAKKYNRRIKNPFDLEPEEERLISQYFREEHNSEFVFVTHYPSKKRPFYAMDTKDDKKLTDSFDLLFRGLEITTGGQRIHDYDEQVEKMLAFNLDPDDFESYLMLHKYGCPPHGGMAIGLERLIMQLLNENNIRKSSLFPRDTLRLIP